VSNLIFAHFADNKFFWFKLLITTFSMCIIVASLALTRLKWIHNCCKQFFPHCFAAIDNCVEWGQPLVRDGVGQRCLVEVEHLRKTDRHQITYIPQSERDRSVTMLCGDLYETY